MQKHHAAGWPIVAVMHIAILFLAACGGTPGSTEDQLREWMATAEAHAEAKERRALLSMLSPSYVDANGNGLDYVDDRLRFWFFRQNSIELLVSIDEIRVFDESAAEMDIVVGMAGTDNSTFGFSADAYRFSLELEYIDDEWLLFAAAWKEIGD